MTDECPFCNSKLLRNDYTDYYSYYCEAKECLVNGDMPKYQAVYHKDPDQLYMMTIMHGGLYIKQNFVIKQTDVSRLQVCIITDNVVIPAIIPIDFADIEKSVNRIKRLLIFS